MTSRRHRASRWGSALAAILILAGAGLTAWFDRMPSTYSAMHMGYADYGTPGPSTAVGAAHGPASRTEQGHTAASADGIPVSELLGDRSAPPDVSYTLVVRRERTTLADGRTFDGYTVNGSTPGPTLEARRGQLVEVALRNDNVAEGTTLHWHGLDVPSGEDGVAGVTQNAVGPGQEHVYRFRPDQEGTFWYHSHQVSHAQVVGGLLGGIVIHPSDPASEQSMEAMVLVHAYDGRRTINGRSGDQVISAPSGSRVRVRLVNTDNGPTQVWVSGAAYRILAIDGEDLFRPSQVTGRSLSLTAGARADLEVVVPSDGARVQLPGISIAFAPSDVDAPTTSAPRDEVDLLGYGTAAPLGFDPRKPDRVFDYRIGRRFGLLDGRPGLWWTINGSIVPDVPMYVVREGDVVVFRITNNSGDVHPMHLHGHHATVLSRNGIGSTGSPWRVDSLNVRTARASRSRSSRTTLECGWTTATTCLTPVRG